MAITGTHGAIKLPTGEQIPQSVMQEINYNNGTIDFKEDDVITFSTSTWTGTVIAVGGTTTSGELHVRVEEPIPSPFLLMTATEEIHVNAIKYAEVADLAGGLYYFQQNVMVGKDMVNHADIDKKGAVKMRFDEGSHQFDAFGKLEVSSGEVLGKYINTYERNEKDWWYEELLSGTVTHITGNQGTLFTIPLTSGAKAAATTHLYHNYQLGVGQSLEMTVALGDTGKADVRRIWGYGDDADGLFFRMEELVLQTYIRSSTIGDHTVPQATWNKDRLDGSGDVFNPSGRTLDVSKDNIYWLDFQWLGAGRVRFGVMLEGVRIVCHEMYHANLYTQPYIRTGSLPVHISMDNLATAGSSSEMRIWGTTIKTHGEFNPNLIEHHRHIEAQEKQNGGAYMAAITNWHPGKALFSIRPALTINGLSNRTVAYPVRLSVTNTGFESMWIQVRRGADLLGTPTWVAFHPASAMEYCEDVDIDQDNGGVQVGMWAIPPNSTENIDLKDVFDYRKEKILLTADDNQDTFKYTFTCWNMSPIAGGEDAGTYTCNFSNVGSPLIATITKTGGNGDFNAVNPNSPEGVAFAAGMMLKIRNSDSDDGYYIIVAVTAATITVKNIDGSITTFTGSTSDVVTLQAGTKSNFFGSLNIEEIW